MKNPTTICCLLFILCLGCSKDTGSSLPDHNIKSAGKIDFEEVQVGEVFFRPKFSDNTLWLDISTPWMQYDKCICMKRLKAYMLLKGSKKITLRLKYHGGKNGFLYMAGSAVFHGEAWVKFKTKIDPAEIKALIFSYGKQNKMIYSYPLDK